jgi:iron complex outermembrane receptor protein
MLLTGLSVLATPVMAQAQEASDQPVTTSVGRVEVQGAGEALGSGYMVEDDASKARSTVTHQGMENSISTSNPYQQINLLPGVSQGQDDALGLSGGVLTIRGLRSDQIGFTINGAPVNDSGNFAVFPQEYVDAENLDQIFVTQGSTDTEAPHVGASGGNIGIVSRAPSDHFAVRGAFTGGENQLGREFIRLDSGRWGDLQGYVSFSQTNADKWRGQGTDSRFHSDGQVLYHLGDTGRASFNWVYNRAYNNFYRQQAFTQYRDGLHPYDFDYATFWGEPGQPAIHLTPGAGAQNESTAAPDPFHPGLTDTRSNFWPLQVNPFENAVLTGDINFQLTPALTIDIAPYFWYGSGGGGFGRTDREGSNTFSSTIAAGYGYTIPNLNGSNAPAGNAADTDTSDTIVLYRSSVTQTNRPGVNIRATYDFDNYNLAVGAWYERARHRQTQPYSYVLNDGSPCDPWMNRDADGSSCVVHDALGRVIQGRDQFTVSEGRALYATLNANYLDDTLRVTGGLAWRSITRDGEARLPLPLLDSANPTLSGVAPAGSAVFIPQAKHPHAEFSEWLPSVAVSYQLDHDTQVFADAARNFRVPANFVFFNYNTSTMTFTAPTVIGGITYDTGSHAPGTVWVIGNNIEPELSWTYEAGWRTQHDGLRVSATAFYNQLDNYQATAQIDAGTKTTINIGGVEIYGVELEVGTAPWNGFTFYGSITAQTSNIDDNVAVTGTGATVAHARTAGSQLPDTPNIILSGSVGYSNGPFFFNINPKYTGQRQVSLVNDAQVDGYTTVDASIGYHINGHAVFRVFGTNLLNEEYVSEINTNATGTSGAFNAFASTTVEGGALAAGSFNVTPGAQRFVGASLTVDF